VRRQQPHRVELVEHEDELAEVDGAVGQARRERVEARVGREGCGVCLSSKGGRGFVRFLEGDGVVEKALHTHFDKRSRFRPNRRNPPPSRLIAPHPRAI
jgi:hypothetical protein